jgi:hypothetical protein
MKNKKHLFAIAVTVALLSSSCGGARGGSGAKFTPIAGGEATSVRVTGNQVVISGVNLDTVTSINLRQAGQNVALSILSKTPQELWPLWRATI